MRTRQRNTPYHHPFHFVVANSYGICELTCTHTHTILHLRIYVLYLYVCKIKYIRPAVDTDVASSHHIAHHRALCCKHESSKTYYSIAVNIHWKLFSIFFFSLYGNWNLVFTRTTARVEKRCCGHIHFWCDGDFVFSLYICYWGRRARISRKHLFCFLYAWMWAMACVLHGQPKESTMAISSISQNWKYKKTNVLRVIL